MAVDQKQLSDLWAKAPPSVSGAFLRSFGTHPNPLPAGTELFKYSGRHPYNGPTRQWTPWWNLRHGPPMKLTDGRVVQPPTLTDHVARAKAMGVSDVRLARVGSAVKDEWNELNKLWIVRLAVPAWGMFGRNSGLPQSDLKADRRNVFNIGGNYQIYVPSLARDDLHVIETASRFETGIV